ncbi:MAG: metal-sensitive transcriptional regulator [Alphaproteobacteria bacterium]|nr:metal-sensitive transcriptional regulator [Alphaproteobacteria bacterium]
MHHDGDQKAKLQKRLARVEGQVRGIQRMIDEDRYCIDVVTQISAVRAALLKVEQEVLKQHVAHCVEHAIATGDLEDQRRKVAELLEILSRPQR